ncbi:MAG: hypothetical protein OXH00_21755 [Candidatus Poribacteria bacterium]|nr:hypothetical protein [Candidatus Poribacteria bacterium]
MTIKFLDRNSSQSVASAPDDAQFSLRSRSDSDSYTVIAEYKEQGTKSMVNAVTIFSGSLDQATANKCIDKIYEHLLAKETFCDLTGIQGEE